VFLFFVDTLPFANTVMLAFLLVNNAVLTGVMFTPSGRGVTRTFVGKNLSTRVMFTPYGRGVTHAFVDKNFVM
jgi:hypothetical protein